MFEIQRTFLLFAVFFVGFLLWEAWQQDYHPRPPSTQELQNSPSTPKSETSTPAISELPTLQSEVGYSPTLSIQTTASAQPVSVITPLLKILVDPQGGDIVSAELLQYPKELSASSPPIQLLTENPEVLFVAQSGLIGKGGPDTPEGKRSLWTAELNSYELKAPAEELKVTLRWENGTGLTIHKIFTFKSNQYLVNVRYEVTNDSAEPWEGQFYGQLKRKNANPNSSSLGTSTYFGATISTPDDSYEKISFEKLAKSDLNKEIKGGWLAFIQHYFLSAWIPEPTATHHYYSNNLGNGLFRIGFVHPTLTVPPHQQKEVVANLYIGPKLQKQLKASAPKLELTVDYGWLWFLAEPLFWLLQWLYKIVGNWGWAIVLVTVIVKAAFFQLSATSYKSMAKMRKVQPRMIALKERYGKDKQQFSQAIMQLYKEEKINPFGGCFPIFVQIPVFIALYWVLLESVELRHAGFILWIHDLSSKDPFYVLPILMGVTMLIQQLLSPPPPDPMQAKMMKALPIVFTFFFLFFPAGLVLYWLVSNALSILQQWLITRVILKEPKKL